MNLSTERNGTGSAGYRPTRRSSPMSSGPFVSCDPLDEWLIRYVTPVFRSCATSAASEPARR